MILVVYTENEILNVIDCPESGITHTNHQIFTGSVSDAKSFFTDIKSFDIEKINQYEKNINL